MIIRIIGTDEQKEQVLDFLKNEKIASDFPAIFPTETKEEDLKLWTESEKGTSFISKFSAIGNDSTTTLRLKLCKHILEDGLSEDTILRKIALLNDESIEESRGFLDGTDAGYPDEKRVFIALMFKLGYDFLDLRHLSDEEITSILKSK